MSSFIPYQSVIGIAFSFGGLFLSPFVSYFHRDFSHSLLIVQMVYLFTNVYTSDTTIFAKNLNASWLDFMPSILTYCNGSSYECKNANLITPLIAWTALTVLLWIIVKVVSIKKPNATFQPVYNFFKGILRWTMIPLFYNSITVLEQSIKEQEYHRDYYASLVVLIYYGLIIFIELVAYKCSQEQNEDTWKKWIQFLNQLKLGCLLMLVSVSYTVNSITKYLLYAPIIIYDIIHLIKYNYQFKIFQRIIFILEEGLLITIYSLFIINSSVIPQYNLDLIAIAFTFLLEIVLLIMRIYSHCRSNGQKQSAVQNEAVEKTSDKKQSEKKPTIVKEKSTIKAIKKGNSFVAEVNLDDTSYAELNGSISSPRKGNRGRLV